MTGKHLLNAGLPSGPYFKEAIAYANVHSVEAAVQKFQPPRKLKLKSKGATPLYRNIDDGTNDAERANVEAVMDTMEELLRTPVVISGAVMPDACPAGSLGTIPVGGVVASTAIHPGMHSADVCCSMAITIFDQDVEPKAVLDAVHGATHFGPGGRQSPLTGPNIGSVARNQFLKAADPMMASHFGTQGDGNHFAFVGRLKSDGRVAIVTHHGSRGPGAAIYKAGMACAEKWRQKLSPDTLKQNAWIPMDSQDGVDYWDALQFIRYWTKNSHFAIHDAAARAVGVDPDSFQWNNHQFWNEHNFVFERDGVFYHAKGATPAFSGWGADSGEFTLIPMNMGQPVLIVTGHDNEDSLGFAPHGAGRNYSRSQHKRLVGDRTDEEIFVVETAGLDVRFFSGNIDVSELPSAYKDAASVRAQIAKYDLCTIVDEVLPYGCIMAGDFEKDAPWKRRKKVVA
ncbi:RtcB family protein [Agrobacterium salinitolerans]|nr:RtcB family protein [Agrobacterium salinitolerans]MCZ7890449.1 RtcB family protein [Agrobacterium salinitolerans]